MVDTIEERVKRTNERKKRALSLIIKRGLPRPFVDEQIYQYQGLIEELELRKVLSRYLEDLPITEENKNTLRYFAEEVDLHFNEIGYFSSYHWGIHYYLCSPFTKEEKSILKRLAAEQLRHDFFIECLKHDKIKIKYHIVSEQNGFIKQVLLKSNS